MSQDSSFERKNVFELMEVEESNQLSNSNSASGKPETSGSSPTTEGVEDGCPPLQNPEDVDYTAHEGQATLARLPSKSPSPKKAPAGESKEKKKAKPRRKRRARNYDDSDSGDGAVDPRAKQLFKKYSANSSKGRGAASGGAKIDTGPYVRVTGVANGDQKARFAVINSATSADGPDSQVNIGRGGVLEPHFYDLASCDPDMPWLCCFCRRPPYYGQLSYLYGPYNISGRCRDYLMSDPHDYYPSEKAYRNSKTKSEPVQDPGPLSVWFHWECFLFTNGCYFLNKLTGLDDAVKTAVKTKCSHCKQHGATLSCCMKNCSKTYHYICGRDSGAAFNEEYCTIFCQNHKNGFQPKRGAATAGDLLSDQN